MKTFIKFLITGAIGVGVGIPIGWVLRKKTSEVQFVECTEEEQEQAMITNGDEHLIPVDKKSIQRPEDIQRAIDGMFGKAEVPDNLSKKVETEIQNEQNREAGIRQMDTQKEQYWKKWHEQADRYDTRSDKATDDVTTLPDDTKEFLDDAAEDAGGDEDEHFGDGRPEIEPADKKDWDRWTEKIDPAYDCVEAWWFDEDNVLSDEDGTPLENPDKFLGFDVRKWFEKSKENDILYMYNHKQKAIFKLIRRHTSFSRKIGMEEFGSDYDGDDDSEDYLRSRN